MASSAAGCPLSTENSSAASRLSCRYRSRSYSSAPYVSPPCASAATLIAIRRAATAAVVAIPALAPPSGPGPVAGAVSAVRVGWLTPFKRGQPEFELVHPVPKDLE